MGVDSPVARPTRPRRRCRSARQAPPCLGRPGDTNSRPLFRPETFFPIKSASSCSLFAVKDIYECFDRADFLFCGVWGEKVRVNLVGRRQRQTFEQMGEFYTCIQHISVSGLRVRGLACTLGGGGQGEGGAGGWALGTTMEKQCSMCGSFRGGGGEHRVTGKLVRCGWCKKEWYCGKECRELCPLFLTSRAVLICSFTFKQTNDRLSGLMCGAFS